MNNESAKSTCPQCGATIPDDAPQGLCPRCVLLGAATVPESPSNPGRRSPPPSTEEVAAHFPDLEILELVGSGGMGAVYRARQIKLDREVALKILSSDLAEDPAFAERFNREAKVLARLNHPHIVTVFDYGRNGPYFFLLMEYVDGVNLRQAMKSGGFTASDSLGIVQEICSALQFAHEEGILHRDIKPENILINARGQVKIADFGIAKLMGGPSDDYTLTVQGSVLGTVHYMAPEQIEHPQDIDQRADIYSLGVVFYELLTGELPIGRFPPPSEKKAMDSRVDEVVLRTLEKERQKRYQSAGEVRTQVEAITGAASGVRSGAGASASPPPPPGRVGTARRATASAVFTGLSLLISVMIVPFFVYILALQGRIPAMMGAVVGLVVMVLHLVPGILGFVFGCVAMAEIRQSGGRLRGLGRSLFGTLAWPVTILSVLIGAATAIGMVRAHGTGLLWLLCAVLSAVVIGVMAVVLVYQWAKGSPARGGGGQGTNSRRGLGILIGVTASLLLLPVLGTLLLLGLWITPRVERSEGTAAATGMRRVEHRTDDPDWRMGMPELEQVLLVDPGHAVTAALVRVDEDGEEPVYPFQGFALAGGNRPFHGRVQFGSTAPSGGEDRSPWILRVESFEGSSATAGGDLPGGWIFDPRPNLAPLALSDQGQSQTIRLAEGREDGPMPVLELRIRCESTGAAGLPRGTRTEPLVGGGTTNWVEAVREE